MFLKMFSMLLAVIWASVGKYLEFYNEKNNSY